MMEGKAETIGITSLAMGCVAAREETPVARAEVTEADVTTAEVAAATAELLEEVVTGELLVVLQVARPNVQTSWPMTPPRTISKAGRAE